MPATETTRAKFWSDEFDLDLLKLFPELEAELGELGKMTLWTVGKSTDGRLNHPAVWNSHGAFVWLRKPNLERDAGAWFNVMGCVSDAPEIECTWLELLRDQWVHGYGFLLVDRGASRHFAAPNPVMFQRLLYHVRGWKLDGSAAKTMAEAKQWITKASVEMKVWGVNETRD